MIGETAASVGEARRTSEAIDVGLMRLCGRDLAMEATGIREVVPLPTTLHADFSGTSACIGTIMIRARAIPVLDIAGHLGFARQADLTGVVVVLREGDRLIGLVMDMVSGLARIPGDHVQSLTAASEGQRPLVTNGFLQDEALYGLIDQTSVFALPGITLAVDNTLRERQAATPRGAVVLISVATAHIAVDAAFVVATVPGDTIMPSPEPAGQWMGVVRYLDQEVPVVDDLGLLGLSGRAGESKGSAVVIVQLKPGHLLGLKIDRIRRIMPLGARSLQALSPELQRQLPLFKGAVVDHEGYQNLMIDHDAVRDCLDLCRIAALTRNTGGPVSGSRGDVAATAMTGEPQAFIVFRAGQGHAAAPLASIKQIMAYPAKVTPARCASGSLCGIASYNGAPLPLFEPAGSSRQAGADRMILVVESDGAYNGLIVEKLETIVRSVAHRWPAATSGYFIQASFDGQSKALTVYDLAAEIRRLAESQSTDKSRRPHQFNAVLPIQPRA